MRLAPRYHHGNETTPATQHRGIESIDGIYVTQDLTVGRSGFMEFGDGPRDHRRIYIDVLMRV